MLKVYWWRPSNGTRNLGDELTSILLTRLFDVPHQRVQPGAATLISTGSILDGVWRRPVLQSRTAPLGIVGTGFMDPTTDTSNSTCAKIYSVRGALSREMLPAAQRPSVLLGDPGSLCAALRPGSVHRRHRFGLIPHISFENTEHFLRRFEALHDVHLIRFRTDDLDAVLEEILSCEIVISQGLHGLILSDAMGVPNVWVEDGPLHRGDNFKFLDYFSTVQRPTSLKLGKGERITEKRVLDNRFVPDPAVLTSVQQQVTEAFERFFADFGIARRRRLVPHPHGMLAP